MEYFSPFRIFNDLTLTSGDDVSYTKLRRKLLAEFELNNNEPIEVEGKFINKSEALALLESIQDERIFNIHFEVFQNEQLLNFLEGNSSEYLFNVDNHRERINELISGIFINRFDKVLSEAYQNEDKIQIIKLLAFPIKTVVNDVEESDPFQGITNKIKNEIAFIKSLKELTPKRKIQKEIQPLMNGFSRQKVELFNVLPIEFEVLRNHYAKALFNVAVTIYNENYDRGWMSKIPLQLFEFINLLKCDEEYRFLAKKNIKRLSKISYKEDQKTNPYIIFIILGILSVFILVIGVATSNTSKNQSEEKVGHDFHSYAFLVNMEDSVYLERAVIGGLKSKINSIDSQYFEFTNEDVLFNQNNVYEIGVFKHLVNSVSYNHKVMVNNDSSYTVVGLFTKGLREKGKYELHKYGYLTEWYLLNKKASVTLTICENTELIFIKGKGWGMSMILPYLNGEKLHTHKSFKLPFFKESIEIVEAKMTNSNIPIYSIEKAPESN